MMARAARVASGLCLGLTVLSVIGCLPPRGGPLEVWVVDERAALDARTAPLLENDVYSASQRTVRLQAAANETIAFQVVLRTPAPASGPFRVELSDLQGPTGVIDSRTQIRCYRVRPVLVDRFGAWYPSHAGRPALPIAVPDVLVPWQAPQGGGPVELTRGENEIVWVDVAVPPDAAPGAYVGRLSVQPVRGKQPVWVAAVHLRVLPVVLPAEPSLAVVCRIDPGPLLAQELGWPREPPERIRVSPGVAEHVAAAALLDVTMTLFHEHRTTPVLWACFPKYRPVGPRKVRLEWEPYDRLVAGWVDGTAFPDQVPALVWPVPASLGYPNAEREGGLDAPEYARLLGAYLAECRRHFEERGWLDRAFVRLIPPGRLTAARVAQVRRAGAILRQSETGFPLVAHLPARSLRGLGWRNAPEIQLRDVGIWAPRAGWYEPDAMRQEALLGRRVWFRPDYPPFSGRVAPDGLATDALCLPWQAARYGADGIWIEHAAECGEVLGGRPLRSTSHPESLVYPGRPFGLPGRPVPSLRLKRLRRGIQDHTLLSMLAQRGQAALAAEVSRQIVRWAFTDACRDNLLSWEEAGWPRAGRTFALARELVLHELVSETEPGVGPGPADSVRVAEWGLLMNQAGRVRVAVEGVRLRRVGSELRARIVCSVLNATNHRLDGRWIMPAVPVGWEVPEEVPVSAPPDTRRRTVVEARLTGLAYNVEGVYPLELQLDTTELGAFAAGGRLAVAVCPWTSEPPTIDGNLADWPLALNNAAGDFRLVRGPAAGLGAGGERPARPTQAFFCRDDRRLYVAIRCALGPGEQPVWQADNRVPLDGAVPWGQDVVELLLDPRRTGAGTASDLYLLQVKPTGVVVARRGCPTEPPLGPSEPWDCGAVVAVAASEEAWSVELALPLAALGPRAGENDVWGLNVTRLDARRGEYASWSGARGDCYRPETLGNLLFVTR